MPRPPGSRPTSSATSTPQPRSTSAIARAGLPVPLTIGSGLTTSTAPGGRQSIEVLQLGQAEPARTEQEVVRREDRVHPARTARVDADRLDAVPGDRPLRGQPARRCHRRSRRVGTVLVGVQESGLVVRPGAPARAEQYPRTCGDLTVFFLPGEQMIGLEQEVRIGGNRVGHVDHRSRPDQPGQRNRVDRETGAAGAPSGPARRDASRCARRYGCCSTATAARRRRSC